MSAKAIPLPGSKLPKLTAISWLHQVKPHIFGHLPKGGKTNETTASSSQQQRES
ncbi:hypothetical protein [Agrobacterium sp.]|uniref:hypothetical protein n=1 Tax=Agrobacterium sp. TaxID=361 RepID=UPI0028A8EE02|nr:hypothetical protein [Agrobacterium sp.]